MTDIHRLRQSEVAELVGVSARTVRDWAATGLPRLEDGRYSGPDVVEWLLSRDRAQNLDLEQQRARLACAQAERVETENEVRRGELLESADVELEWADLVAAARAKLLSIPARLSPRLTNIASRDEIYSILKAEIYSALTELANYKGESSDQPQVSDMDQEQRQPGTGATPAPGPDRETREVIGGRDGDRDTPRPESNGREQSPRRRGARGDLKPATPAPKSSPEGP